MSLPSQLACARQCVCVCGRVCVCVCVCVCRRARRQRSNVLAALQFVRDPTRPQFAAHVRRLYACVFVVIVHFLSLSINVRTYQSKYYDNNNKNKIILYLQFRNIILSCVRFEYLSSFFRFIYARDTYAKIIFSVINRWPTDYT